MRADPRFHAAFLCAAIGRDDDGAADMIFCDLCDELGVLFQRSGRFAVNRQIDERRACHRALALGPKFFQLLFDLADLDRKSERIIFSGGGH